MEAINVIDSAVKIGLGALIGGLITYFLQKLNHKKETERECQRRHRELAEDIAAHCNTVSVAVRNYWALMADWVSPSVEEKPDESKIRAASEVLYDSFHELTVAEGKLYLIGEEDLDKKLRDYALAAQKFYGEIHLDNKGLSYDDLKSHMESLRDKRKTFLSELGNSYRKHSF